MNFATPNSLIWAALALPIVLLYVLRPRRRPVEVTTGFLWRRALARRSRWPLLRHWLSLTLHLLMLAAIVLALAQPYWSTAASSGRAFVLIIDTSASMCDGPTGQRLLDVAKQRAETVIGAMGQYDKLAILSSSSSTRIESRFQSDVGRLLESLAGIAPTEAPGDLRQAVRLSQRMLAGEANSRLIVFTDGAIAPSPDSDQQTHWVQVGRTRENVAITRMSGRPSRLSPASCDVLAELTAYTAAPIEVAYRLRLNGAVVAEHDVRLSPGEPTAIVDAVDASEGGQVTASVDWPDALACDNQAVLLLPQLAAVRIQLHGQGAELPVSQAARLSRVEFLDEGEASSVAGHVYAGNVPADLPAGLVIAVAPATDCSLWTVEGGGLQWLSAEPIQQPMPSRWMAGVDFGNAMVERRVILKFTRPVETLLATPSGGALVSLITRPDGDVLVVHAAASQENSELARVIELIVLRALQSFTVAEADVLESLSAGGVVRFAAADAVRQATAPDGAAREVAAGQSMLGPLNQCGLWKLPGESNSGARLAPVNLLSPRESNLTAAELGASYDVSAVPAGAGKPLWQWFAGVACLLLVIEWFALNRRVTV